MSRVAWWRASVIAAAAFASCVLAYLVYAVPGPWFASASPRGFGAEALTLTRGMGALVDGELVVTAPDASGMTVVSVVTRFRSSEYRAVRWVAIGLPESASASLLFSNDYAPQTLNSVPLRVEAGRPLPVLPTQQQGWIGNVTGLALAIQGPLPQPLRIRGVMAMPMGASEVLAERVHEWVAFDRWTGTSINTVEAGADIQAMPLPVFLAAVVAIAFGTGMLLRRFAPSWFPIAAPMFLAALFVGASWLLDARWMWNLGRQVAATASQFAGRDIRERHLTGDDALLYAFVEKAREKLPTPPARVFVVADAPYFRDRAAYHLYPHNVWFDPLTNAIPTAGALRPGDWLVAYQRRGLQYSPTEHRLRWEGGQSVGAELALAEGYGALFRIR